MNGNSELARLEEEIIACRRCPRLVEHRERIAALKAKRFADETYWGRPVPSFGDSRARLLVVGLAPAAHGANRTGRMFTGDRSGDWLYETMHRYGFANRARSVRKGDGLRLRQAYVTAVVRCAPPENKPSRDEREACRGYLLREIDALDSVEVVIALGRVAFDGFLDAWRRAGRELPSPKPKFSHGAAELLPRGVWLLGSYHPSQQNTFTGKLTRAMFRSVFRKARRLLERKG